MENFHAGQLGFQAPIIGCDFQNSSSPVNTRSRNHQIQMKLNYRLPSTIEGMRHMMDILMNKMYVNPPVAAVRQILSNAIDANRTAGTTGIAIEQEGSRVSITDRGRGVSPEVMQSLFKEFGLSTKRDNEQSIGAFGIGATSIFAVGGVTIITNTDRRRTYQARLEKGLPVIELVEEDDPEEGTTVSFDVGDTEIPWSTLLLDIPEATLKSHTRPPVFAESENWVLFGAANMHVVNELFVSVKGVCYKCSSNRLLNNYFKYWNYSRPFTGSLVVRCDDLSLSAFREQIEEEEATALLKARIQEVVGHFKSQIEADLARGGCLACALKAAKRFPFLNTDGIKFGNTHCKDIPKEVFINSVGIPGEVFQKPGVKTSVGFRDSLIETERLLEYPVFWNKDELNVTQLRRVVDEKQFFFTSLQSTAQLVNFRTPKDYKKKVRNAVQSHHIFQFEIGKGWVRVKSPEGLFIREKLESEKAIEIMKVFGLTKLFTTKEKYPEKLIDLWAHFARELEEFQQRNRLMLSFCIQKHFPLPEPIQTEWEVMKKKADALNMSTNVQFLPTHPWDGFSLDQIQEKTSKEEVIENYLKHNHWDLHSWLSIAFSSSSSPSEPSQKN